MPSAIETFSQHIERGFDDQNNLHIRTGTALHEQYIAANVEAIRAQHRILPDVIIGVSGRTNDAARVTAETLDSGAFGLYSAVDTTGKLFLPKLTKEYIETRKPDAIVILDDIGLVGTSAAQIAQQLRECGGAVDADIRVVYALIPEGTLSQLDAVHIDYASVINPAHEQ